jgi:hypothetical protein
MKTLLKPTLAALALLGCASWAQAEDVKVKGPGGDCVFFRTVNDWRALDDTNLVVWGPGKNSIYLVKVSMPLVGLKFENTLAFVDGNHDGRLCPYGGDSIVVNETGFKQRSSIHFMSQLDAETIAKLEEKYKVSLTRQSGKKKIPKEPDAATAQ